MSKPFSSRFFAILLLCLSSVFLSAQNPAAGGTSSSVQSNPQAAAATAGAVPAQAQQPAPSEKTSDSTAQQTSPEKEKDQGALGEIVQQKPTPPPQSKNENTGGKVAGTSNDRLFYTLPNFLTLQNAGKLPPLTAKQKFKVVALSTFDPVQYPWWALLSAISQAENSEPAFGQGWAAYGKRYGTTAGDSTVENFMVGAVFPSVLHQDPRFYQSSVGGFGHRTLYAVTRIVLTRGDSGKTQFNYSEVFGAAFAAAVSTYSYHPKSTYISTPTNPHMFIASDRTLRNTASVWATQIGLDTTTIVVKEFWPDIHRKLSHKHQGVAQTRKSLH